VYPTSSDSAEALFVTPQDPGFDFKSFELDHIFPNGYISVRINKAPGTTITLPSAWRIYMDSGRCAAPLNSCIKHKFGLDWAGNIVLIKHRRNNSDHIAQISTKEEDYADVILNL
ncbi:hypothetical protein DFH06DRAFT_1005538, partial [Mycena polygramma]